MSDFNERVAFVRSTLAKDDGHWRFFRACSLCGYINAFAVRKGSSPEDWPRFVEIAQSSRWGQCDGCGAYTDQPCVGTSPREA